MVGGKYRKGTLACKASDSVLWKIDGIHGVDYLKWKRYYFTTMIDCSRYYVLVLEITYWSASVE